jgi:hypothetical protein
MIQTLMNSNKQMRYKVVLLIPTKMFNNKSQSVKTKESTMDIKNASACAVQDFFLSLFLLFLSFEQVDIESKQGVYMPRLLILKKKINF